MHPFPPTSDLQFLVGDRLDSVTIMAFMVNLSFDSGSYISAESTLEYDPPAGARTRYDVEDLRNQPVNFHACVHETVQDVDVVGETLILTFSNAGVLKIFTEINGYESGQIQEVTANGARRPPIIF